ncbi:MAG: hypothetical protein HYZ14_15310 [Bacteroidetes bacterium]|nr:hypothetical protein [Bacteroidota bacterium]
MEKKKGKNKQGAAVAPQKKSYGKYILIGLGLVAVAGGVYYFVKRNSTAGGALLPQNLTDLTEVETKTSSSDSVVIPQASSGGSSAGFPLKRGSRGEWVKKIQQLLIQKYGSSILPKYGADGTWGSEMETALINKGLPNQITEQQIKQWTAAGVITLSGLGQVLCDQIRSLLPVRVWNQKGEAIKVPRGTILGEFLEGRNGVAKFRTLDGKILFTNTHCIGYV